MNAFNARRAWLAAVLVSTLALAQCGGDNDLDGETPPPDEDEITVQRAFPDLEFEAPLYIATAPGDTQRLFVVEQGGRIYAINRSASTPSKQLFLDIRSRVAMRGEQGLLGLAFDPDYASNRRFYVYYNAVAGAGGATRSTVVARYTVNDAGQGDASTEAKLLTIPLPAAYTNHNGGWIGFGPDGKLYIAVGDGGGSGDPQNNAQNRNALLGKLLRIEPNGAIPPDNPFVGQSNVREEVWAYGLRNPFRVSFDREDGTLWIADVGQGRWEEINIGAKGGNYGWRKYEGDEVFNTDDPAPANVTMPAFQYDHSNGRCSIIGGYAYRGATFTGLQGRYVFADYCSGEVWVLDDDRDSSTRIATVAARVTSFGEDQDGELYLTAADGALYQIVAP